MNLIKELAKCLKEEQAVIYTGAGVSTNSGIADFRGENGFYKKYHEDDLSVQAFFRDTNQFYVAFQEKFSSVFHAQPNLTHQILAELENDGYIAGIITQNVDRLHQKAGSKNVIEFHGNIFEYDLIDIMDKRKGHYKIVHENVPYHTLTNDEILTFRLSDRKVYKPKVVLFGEDISFWQESVELSKRYNLHIIMGTSFLVTPFNRLSYENKHADLKVFVINNEPITYYNVNNAEIIQIIGDTSEILEELKKELRS